MLPFRRISYSLRQATTHTRGDCARNMSRALRVYGHFLWLRSLRQRAQRIADCAAICRRLRAAARWCVWQGEGRTIAGDAHRLEAKFRKLVSLQHGVAGNATGHAPIPRGRCGDTVHWIQRAVTCQNSAQSMHWWRCVRDRLRDSRLPTSASLDGCHACSASSRAALTSQRFDRTCSTRRCAVPSCASQQRSPARPSAPS